MAILLNELLALLYFIQKLIDSYILKKRLAKMQLFVELSVSFQKPQKAIPHNSPQW